MGGTQLSLLCRLALGQDAPAFIEERVHSGLLAALDARPDFTAPVAFQQTTESLP